MTMTGGPMTAMTNDEFTKHLERKKDTDERFNYFRQAVMSKCDIGLDLYNYLETHIITVMGYFDKDKGYCGPGWLGNWLVPDGEDNFAGYFHDGCDELMERGLLDTDFRDKANLAFKTIIRRNNPSRWKRVKSYSYWKMVDWFWNPKKKKRG